MGVGRGLGVGVGVAAGVDVGGPPAEGGAVAAGTESPGAGSARMVPPSRVTAHGADSDDHQRGPARHEPDDAPPAQTFNACRAAGEYAAPGRGTGGAADGPGALEVDAARNRADAARARGRRAAGDRADAPDRGRTGGGQRGPRRGRGDRAEPFGRPPGRALDRWAARSRSSSRAWASGCRWPGSGAIARSRTGCRSASSGRSHSASAGSGLRDQTSASTAPTE